MLYMYWTIDTHAIMKSQLQVCTGYGDHIPKSRPRILPSVSFYDWRVITCAKRAVVETVTPILKPIATFVFMFTVNLSIISTISQIQVIL